MIDRRPAVFVVLCAVACLDAEPFVEEAPCPCLTGFVCCASTQTCRAPAACSDEPSVQVDTITPLFGPAEGGTRLVFEGSGLNDLVAVRIGDRPCHDLTRTSNEVATCTTGPQNAGEMRIVFTLEGGTERTFAQRFRFLRPPLTPLSELLGRVDRGRGLAVYDADADGMLDLLFTHGSTEAVPSTLFVNGGALRFESRPMQLPTLGVNGVTAFGLADGPALFFWPRAVSEADALLVDTSVREVAVEQGIGAAHAVDFDGDGALDVLGCREVATGIQTDAPIFFARAERGTLVEVPAGSFTRRGACQSAALADYDGDGDVDVAACGEFFALFENVDGTLTDVTERVGLPVSLRTSGRLDCTALGWADFDGDGDLDLWGATDASRTEARFGVRLFANRVDEDGGFDAVGRIDPAAEEMLCAPATEALAADSALAGGHRAVAWFDADLDGDLDVFVPSPAPWCSSTSWLYVSEVAQGSLRYRPVAIAGGGLASGVTAVVAADLDGDGDLDVVGHGDGLGPGPLLFRNEAVENGTSNRWLSVRAEPGSRVEVDLDGPVDAPDFEVGAGRLLVRTLSGDGVGAQPPPVAHFGLGEREVAVGVRVVRPDGSMHREIVDTFDRTLTIR